MHPLQTTTTHQPPPPPQPLPPLPPHSLQIVKIERDIELPAKVPPLDAKSARHIRLAAKHVVRPPVGGLLDGVHAVCELGDALRVELCEALELRVHLGDAGAALGDGGEQARVLVRLLAADGLAVDFGAEGVAVALFGGDGGAEAC